MSRIGKKPITLPSNVTLTDTDGLIIAKGSKGELSYKLPEGITLLMAEGKVQIKRKGEDKKTRALHGLARSLVQNMITGVSEGFVKRLEINGVGYRFQLQGKKIVLSLGYSHPVEYTPAAGVELKADEEKKNVLVISGIDKQKVGQVASEIRGFRKPEPYKGKGIKYENEHITRKAGKTASK